MENCIGCYWEDNCMFKGTHCDYYSPSDDFAQVDYIEDMATRLFDYRQMYNEYSDGNR